MNGEQEMATNASTHGSPVLLKTLGIKRIDDGEGEWYFHFGRGERLCPVLEFGRRGKGKVFLYPQIVSLDEHPELEALWNWTSHTFNQAELEIFYRAAKAAADNPEERPCFAALKIAE